MITLRFKVDGETISKERGCDFSSLNRKSDIPVRIEFSFSDDWLGFSKVSAFISRDGKEFAPQYLTNNTCMIPTEALDEYFFYIRVLGKRGSTVIKTNKIAIIQNGGGDR